MESGMTQPDRLLVEDVEALIAAPIKPPHVDGILRQLANTMRENERLQMLLTERDLFIVNKDLWTEFAASLDKPNKDSVTPTQNSSAKDCPICEDDPKLRHRCPARFDQHKSTKAPEYCECECHADVKIEWMSPNGYLKCQYCGKEIIEKTTKTPEEK